MKIISKERLDLIEKSLVFYKEQKNLGISDVAHINTMLSKIKKEKGDE